MTNTRQRTDVDFLIIFFFSSRRRHTRLQGDWSSDVCSSDLERMYIALTIPMMAKHARTCRMVRAMYIRSLLRRGADARRLANDPDEPLRVEAGAADEGSVPLGLRQQRVGVLGLDAAAIQDTDGLRDFLRRELGQEPPEERLHLG